MKHFIIFILFFVASLFSATAYAFTNASLEGEYWFGYLKYNTSPYYRSELGTVTFDGNGNYAFNGIYSMEDYGAGLPTSTKGVYSITSDGQISIDGANVGRLDDNGETVIGCNVSSTAYWGIFMMVKKATSNVFTNASLDGEYWFAHFEYSGDHITELGTVTFDGNGNYTFNGIYSEEGVGPNLPSSRSGDYSITSDGKISIDGTDMCRLGADGETVIGSNVSDPEAWSIMVLVKKTTSNSFTNASLKGKYWFGLFKYNTAPCHRSQLGTLTFDGNGKYTFNGIKSNEGEGADLPVSSTGVYSITSDGQISIDGTNDCRLAANGEIGFGCNVWSTNDWALSMFLKKGNIKSMPWLPALLLEE